MERFIEKVKSFPCLWDMDDPAYKDFEMMEKAWTKVASTTNFPDAKAAKMQWKKLRDNFREALKRHKDSKGTGRMWRYQQQMEFLIPFMQSKYQDFSLTAEPDADKPPDIKQQQQPDVGDTFYGDDKDEDSVGSSFARKRQKVELKEDFMVRFGGGRIAPGNALLDFFSSMYNTTEELPAHLQLQVKRKVFEVVTEAEETGLLLRQQQQEYDTQYFT